MEVVERKGGLRMKRYYCPTCKEFKYRFQLKRVDDTRIAWLTCRWCHNSNIYKTEDIFGKLIEKSLDEKDFSSRHGSFI